MVGTGGGGLGFVGIALAHMFCPTVATRSDSRTRLARLGRGSIHARRRIGPLLTAAWQQLRISPALFGQQSPVRLEHAACNSHLARRTKPDFPPRGGPKKLIADAISTRPNVLPICRGVIGMQYVCVRREARRARATFFFSLHLRNYYY